MKNGDTVKFIDGLYADEVGLTYKVVEMNGDRMFIELICNLPFRPQSVARTNEMVVVEEADDTPQSKKQKRIATLLRLV